MKKKLKKLVACVCSTLMISSIIPDLGVKVAYASNYNYELNNIIVEEVPNLDYDEETKTYTGTAYLLVNSINIYPFANNPKADIKVNNNKISNGKQTVNLKEGMNTIKVSIDENEYTLKINKVNTDYRGRAPIDSKKIDAKTDFGGELSKMFDGNLNTSWSPTIAPKDESETNAATSFVLDLGETRWISRIVADMGGSGYPLWKCMARISTSIDGETWEIPITKGNMREDQKNVRYEFGKSYEARYVKYEIIKFNQANLKINELTVFEDPNGEFPTYPAPEGGDKPYVPENPNIASGQSTVIEKGFPISGWMASEGYGRGTPNKEESELFGWDGPLFYDPELSNKSFMENNPDALWGIAKAPWGDNGMEHAGEPREFVPESLKPYINNAINFCFGDEGLYSTEENKRFKKWFEYSKELYPGTIVHSNQAGGRGWEGNFKEYVRDTEPDMLSYDDYYYWQDAGTNHWNYVYQALNTTLWKEQREAALLGVDGTGTKPILFGQYLDIWKVDQQESMKKLIVNLSMLTGMKWLNHFRLEYQFDGCYLFDEDGTPTQGLYEWGEVNRYLKLVDDYILLLNNDYVITKPGKHGSGAGTTNNVANGWRMGSFDSNQEKNKEFGILEVNAENNNLKANNGLPGDVVLGYFNALPGLYPEDLTEKFGCDAPKAFMILNGLSAGSGGRWNNRNIIGKEAGSSENTVQTITITVDPKGRALKKVNRNTGEVENVEIINDEVVVTLGGGEAELFFWQENTNATTNSLLANQPAYFAFDNNANTHWQPAENVYPVTVEKTFYLQTLDRIIINEIGNNVSEYSIQYKGEDDNWNDLVESGSTIGANLEISGKGVKAKGLRLSIINSNDTPKIRDIRYYGEKSDTSQRVITINDNVMGNAINHFSYDDKWSYRENENNQGLDGLESKDVHFSNLENAVAKFKFYGTDVELVFRNNNGNGRFNISIDGGIAEAFSTTGTGGNTISKIFEGLTQDVHEVVITKTGAAQASIDCAKVTYTGEIPKDNEGATNQTYINDKTIGTGKNQVNYSSTPVAATNKTTDITNKAVNGFASWTQDNESNIGFTVTDKQDAYYEIKFYGTDLVVYGGQKVAYDSGSWGTITYSIDGGEEIVANYENINDGGNPNISLPVLKIHASDENADHTVRVINKTGRARLDYAVAVESAEVGNEAPVAEYTVTANINGNGTVNPSTVTVNEHGNALFTVSPSEGYKIEKATAVGKNTTIDGNIVTVHDVTGNINLNITIAEDIPSDVTKEMLQAKYDEAISLEKLNYKGSSYASLQTVINDTNKILESEDSTSAQYKTSYISLGSAIKSLVNAADTTPKDYPTETSQFIDNTDQSVIYTGTWNNGEGSWTTNKYMNSQHINENPTVGTVTIPFIGSGISIYMESKSGSSNMNIVIKDENNNVVVSEENIILNGTDKVPTDNKLAYTINNLSKGNYKAVLTFNGGNRAAFDGAFIETAETEKSIDFNKNGRIDIGDLSIVSKYYGQENIEYDLNNDKVIDDFEIEFITRKIFEQ